MVMVMIMYMVMIKVMVMVTVMVMMMGHNDNEIDLQTNTLGTQKASQSEVCRENYVLTFLSGWCIVISAGWD